MRYALSTALLCSVLAAGCGVVNGFADVDPKNSSVSVSTAIAPADGNSAVEIVVQLRYSATVSAAGVPVALSLSGSPVSLGRSSGSTDAKGVFRTTMTAATPGTVRVTASVRGQSGSTTFATSVNFVSVAAGVSLGFGPIATVGKAQTLTVTVVDETGQRVLYYGGTMRFASSDPLANLPSIYQFSAADQGLHAFDSIVFRTLGTQSLTATDVSNANITATVSGIEVYADTPPMLEVSGITNAVAGTVNQVRVRAVDISGHTVTAYTGTVHFTSTDAMAQLPVDTTFGTTDAGVKALPVVLKTGGIQAVSVVDTNNVLISGVQQGIGVWVVADRFHVTLAASAAAGAPAAAQVVATDAYGNTDPNYIGPMVVSSSDLRADLPSAYGFTPADAGVHNANVTFYTSGPQSLTVRGSSSDFSGVADTTVVGAAAASLALLGPPTATAGTLSTWVATAYDTFGNVSDGYTGTIFTTSSDGNAVLPGSMRVTPSMAGSLVLTGVVLKTAGSQTLTVTDPNLALSANAMVTVANAPAASFGLSGLQAVSAGVAQQMQVAAYDAFGNPAVDYLGTVVTTSDDSRAQLPPATTFGLLDAGTRTLSPVTLKTAGSRSVSVNDTLRTGVRGSESNILIASLPASALVVTSTGAAAVGAQQNLVVRAVDVYGNTDPGFAGTVTLSSSDPDAGLPVPYTFGPADAGVATLSAAFYAAGRQSVTATDGSIHSAPAFVTVVAGTTAKLGLSGLTGGRAGRTQNLVVQALDDFNNLVPSYVGGVLLNTSDGNATLASVITLSGADGGQKLVPVTLVTAGVQSVSARDAAVPSIAGSQGNILITAVADRLWVQSPAVLTAGGNFTLTVAGADAYSNIDTGYTGTVSLGTTSASSTLPPTLTITAGGVVNANVALTGAGTQLAITAQDTVQPFTGTRGGIRVLPGAAAALSVQAPSPAYAGLPFSAVLTAFDAYGNLATGYTGSVRLSSSDVGASLGGVTAFASAGQGSATAVNLVWGGANVAAALTATDILDANITGTQTGIVVRAGGAARLRLFGATSGVAGHTDTVTVMAVDNSNNLATGYTGTVRLTSTDPRAALPPSYTFSAGDSGAHAFAVTWGAAGSRTLNVQDTGIGALNANQTGIVITPAPAQALALTDTGSGGIVAGVARSLQISAVDAYGNTDPNYVGVVTIVSGDAGAALPGPVSMGAGAAGVTHVPYTLRTAGTQFLAAQDGGSPALSGNLTGLVVQAAAVAALSVSGIADAPAGTSNSATVAAVDAFNNLVTTYAGTVHFTSSDASAVLSGDVTLRVSDQGSRQVPLTLYTGGLQSVTATDAQTPTITGTQGHISVRVTRSRLLVTAPSSVASGQGFNITVAAVDGYGNIDPDYTGTVALTGSDAQALFGAASTGGPGSPASLTFASADAGQKLLPGVILTSATAAASITATDGAQALFGQRLGITVTSGPLTRFAIGAPASVYAGVAFIAQIGAVDAAGNPVTGYIGSATVSSSDGAATLPSSITFGPSDAGVLRLSGLVMASVGGRTLSVTDGNGITGSATIAVSALAPVSLLVTGATPGVAGHSDSVTVTAVDSYGNPANGNVGVITLASTDAQALLPAPFALGGGNTHVFSGVQFRTAGVQTLSATAAPPGGAILAGEQNHIVITAGASSGYGFAGLQDVQAGAQQIVTVSATDAFGNLNPNTVGSVTLGSSDANASLPGTISLLSGQASFGVILNTVGRQHLDASGNGLNGTSPNVMVGAASATHFVVSGLTGGVAGQVGTVTITAYDAFNNVASDYVGSVALTTGDPLAALPSNLLFTGADAGTQTAYVSFYTPGTQSLTATDTVTGITGQQTGIVVTSGQRFVLTGPPSVTAGATFSIGLQAVDNSNNVDPSFTGTVYFASNDPRATVPAGVTFTGADGGQKTVSGFTLATSGNQLGILATTVPSGRSGALYPLTVGMAAVAGFTVTAPSVVTAGSGFNFKVAATDAYGNTVPSYTGTAVLTSSDANATLPGPLTFAGGDAGVRTVSATLRTATGTAVLTATDPNRAGFFGQQGNIIVVPLATVSSLAFSNLNAATAGQPVGITVTALDAYGNAVPQYRGQVSFSSSDTQASLPGNYGFIGADHGSHAFSGIVFAAAGTRTLQATDGNRTVNANVTVSAGAATFFAVGTSVTAVSGQTQNVTLVATDAYGNVDTNYAGSVTLTTTDPMAVMPPTYTFVALDAGRHTLQMTWQSAGTQALFANGPAGVVGTQGSIIVNPAATTRFSVSGLSQAATGIAASVTVRALDAAGNTTPAYTGTMRLSASDARATLPSNYAFTSGAGGQHTSAITFATSGTQSVTATDVANANITGTLANIAVSASAVSLQCVAAASATAGASLPVTVRVIDNYNNIATGWTGTVLVDGSDAQATYPVTVNFVSADQGSKTLSGAFKTSGSQSFRARDSQGVLTSSIVNVSIAPGATDHYDIAAPASVAAGGNITLSLAARDAYGNATPTYSGTAAFTSSDGTALVPGNVVFSAGSASPGVARAFVAGAGTTFTATDTTTPAIFGTSGGIVVTPLGTVKLSVAGATAAVAGQAQSVVVAARDMYNNVTPAYRGTVALTSTDVSATLPASYTFVLGDNGSRNLTGIVLATAGNQAIVATDTAAAGITGSQNNIAITAGSATLLRLATAGSSTAGVSQVAAVAAVDAYGNPDTGFRGSVTLTATDAQATLPAPYAFVAGDAGNHNFSVTLATAGAQPLTAQSAGLTSAQATVTVVPAGMATLSVAGLVRAPAGTSQAATVRAIDNFNNTVPSYRGTVALASTDARAALSGNYTYLTGDAGSKSLPVTLFTRGWQRVSASDTLNPNYAGAQNVAVTVTQTQLTVTSDTQVVAGVGFNVTVSATDAYGNINPNYAGTVHFTSSDPNAVLPADVIFGSGNQGVVYLYHQATFKTASLSQTLTATDGNNNFTGTQSGIAVSPGPAALLSVGLPTVVTAGTAFTLATTAYDAYGNVATSYTGSVGFSASDGNSMLPPLSNFTLANLGNKTFSGGARLVRAGAQFIYAYDTNNGISGTGATTVQSAVPSTLALTGPAITVAGAALTLTVTSYDRYGNIATGMNDTVSIVGTDTSGTYPSSYTFVSGDAGAKVLTGLTTLRTAGVVGLTATDVVNTGVTAGLLYLTVNPAPISSIAITAPASVTAAGIFSATVAGVDAYMNVVSNYAGVVQLSSTDPAGLPSSTTMLPVSFSAGSAAQRTVGGLRLLTAGAQLLSATDANGVIFGSTPVQVNAGAAAALQVATAANIVAGTATGVTVTAVDAGNNIAQTFTGGVSFVGSDANATYPGTTTFASADHGQKVLPAALTWRGAGAQVLYASASGVSTGNANVTVAAAGAAGLQVYGVGNLLAGATNQATVRALDAFGNTAPSYTGTVTLGSSDTAATLPGPASFASADAGIKTLALRLYTSGLQSVTATDSGNGYMATQANIFVRVQRSRFSVSSPNSVVAGVPLTLSVAATDAYNNLDANFTGALHFASTDGNASFPAGISILAADHGQKSIANFTLTTANANATISVLDNTNTVIGTSNAIAVAPAGAFRLGVSTVATTAAGTPVTASVTAYDAYANIAKGYAGTVVVTTGNSNAVLPGPSSFVGNGNGTLAIPGIYLLAATNNTSVTVTDNANASITGSRTGIQVTALGADHFVLAGMSNGVAGHVNTLSVLARDIYNNVATSYQGTVGFSSTDSGAMMPGNYQYVGSDQGNRAFSGVALTTAGTWSVTATDSAQSAITGSQSGIIITNSAATRLTLTGAAGVTAGQAQNILVSALDTYGNIDAGFTGTVAFTSTDPNATLPASHSFSGADAGTWLLPLTYTTAATQTLTASGPAAVGSVQINTVVSAGNANAYVVSGIPNIPAGQATSVTVRVIDAYNNTVPLYRGQTRVTSSDTNAVLPGYYTFGSTDNGVKALGLTLTTAGTQWVQATDTNTSSITGRQSGITVGVAQSHLQVVSNTNVVAGAPFSVSVTAVDAFGNLNTGYTGTVHFSSPDANATLPGNTLVANANNGSITLAGVVLRQATANQSITATDTNVSTYTGSQTGIAVNPANANSLLITGPASTTAGVSWSPVVTAYDAYANVATGYTGAVTFASSDPGATRPGPASFASVNAGVKTFTNAATLVTSGNQTLTVLDTNNGFSSTKTVAVSAASTATLALTASSASVAGNVIPMTVQAQDVYGNIAPTYRGAVTFSSGDPNASYPGNYTYLAGDAGQHTFSTGMVLRQSGTNLVTVGDVNNAVIAQGTVAVAVNPGPIIGFRVAAPAAVVSEAAFLATISGLDSYGNVANTYTGTTRVTSSDPNGVPSATSPFNLTFVSGGTVQRSISGLLLNTAGSQTLYARDANNPNTLNGQANVTVTPLPAGSLYLSGFPVSVTAGQQGNITVRAYDNYGNIASGYAATVHFTSSDPNAVLPGDYTFQPSDAGIRTFTSLALRTAAASASITATDGNGVTGTETLIAVGPTSPNRIVVTAPATAIAGVGFNVTVTAQDVYSNVATGYRGTVNFSSSNSNALVPSAYTFVSNDAGQHLFPAGATVWLSGNQNITAADSNHTAAAAVAVTSTNGNALVWTTVASTVAGTALTPTLTVYDRYGNQATTYAGTVGFSSSDTNATLQGNYTFGVGDAGNHNFVGGFVLRNAGSRTLVATDTNAAALVVPASTTIAVSPNITTNLSVLVPATVQPALVYSSTITARDAYANVTPAYLGTISMSSTDGNAVPSNTVPTSATFSGGNAGVITVNNLRLQTVGSQTLSAHDTTTTSIAGSGTTTVAAQNANALYLFTTATSPNYTYNTSQISLQRSNASLVPTYTVASDYNATVLAASFAVNTVNDSNGYVRLSNANTVMPYMFYSGLDMADPTLTWTNTVDATMGGATNVTGFCCGLSGPESNPNGYVYRSGSIANTSILYSGYANGGGTTSAYTKIFSLPANTTLAAESYLYYYFMPEGSTGAYSNPGVNANNSMYTIVDLVFTDGTDLASAAVVDGNNVTFTPAGVGASNRIALNQWNFVRVPLGSLAGKKVDHIDLLWQKNGATGGYRGWVDQIQLIARASSPNQFTASMNPNWTPQWNNLVDYWSFDGVGAIANNQNVVGVKGHILQGRNNNGYGMSYVNGQVGQAITFDSIDDVLQGPSNYSIPTGSITFMYWTRWLNQQGQNSGCTTFFNLSADGGNNLSAPPGCGQDMMYYTANGTTFTGFFADSTIMPQPWSHMAWTIDSNTNQICGYRDGGGMGCSSVASTFSTTTASVGLQTYATALASMDEVAIWKTALNSNEIYSIYTRQAMKYSGQQTMPISTTNTFSTPYVNMQWSDANTTSAVSNANLLLYWNLDEPSRSTYAGGDFNDLSGNGYTGAYPAGGIIGEHTIMGLGASNFGSSSFITSPTIPGAAPDTFTIAVWFLQRGYPANGGGLMGMTNGAHWDRMLYIGTDGILRFGVFPNTFKTVQSNAVVGDRRWHLAVGSLGPAGQRIYVDGVLQQSDPTTTNGASYTGAYWLAGAVYGLGGWAASGQLYLTGAIDDVRVYTRQLADAEVKQLYLNGATRLLMQSRRCTTSTCSDNPNWLGPDGTASTYFSSTNVSGQPNYDPRNPQEITGAGSYTLSTSVSAPYVQYQAILQSDDYQYLCNYAGAAAPCSPLLADARVESLIFPSSAKISLVSGATPYYTTQSFAQTIASMGCAGGVTYTLSPDGQNYYYWNGSAWLTSNNSVGQSSTAAALTNSAITSYSALTGGPHGGAVPPATYFNAFLSSNGNQPCALQSLNMAISQ